VPRRQHIGALEARPAKSETAAVHLAAVSIFSLHPVNCASRSHEKRVFNGLLWSHAKEQQRRDTADLDRRKRDQPKQSGRAQKQAELQAS
jgi:hypothetical protein